MKIAIVSSLYPPVAPGGAEISTQILAEGLTQLGHEVLVCSLVDVSDAQPVRSEQVTPGWRPYEHWATNGQPDALRKTLWHLSELSDKTASRHLTSAVTRYGADAVLTQNMVGLGSRTLGSLATSLYNQCPVVHTLRDYGLMCVRASRYHGGRVGCGYRPTCLARRAMTRAGSLHVSGVVGISSFVLRAHTNCDFFAGVPARVIPNAVENRATVSRPAGSRRAIGYLGNLSHEKGVTDLITAYKQCIDARIELPPLSIAGSGTASEIDNVRKLSTGYPIELLGRVDTHTFLSSIGLLVVPSRWDEPFGRVVIEAAQHRLPIIASDRGGLPEALRLSAPESYLDSIYPAGDIRALSSLMYRFATDGFPATKPPTWTAPAVGAEYIEFIRDLAG